MKRIIILLLAVFLAMPLMAEAAGDTPCISSGLLVASAVLHGGKELCSVLIITDGTNAATATIYDNATTSSGTVLFKGTVAGASNFGGGDAGSPVMAGNGLYLLLSGTGASAIVFYR